MNYKETLNLPQTDFPLRAKPALVEPELLAFWDASHIYQKMLEKNCGSKAGSTSDTAEKKFILHDGPPYPNGDIHLGHALNKILKDITIKYKSMCGYYAPYLPGWDCHGLPIESQLIKELGDGLKDLQAKYGETWKVEFRQRCREYAMRYVDLQRAEFKKLGVLGEWENPYLSINRDYEGKIAGLFGILAEKGFVYRGLKPIHWCPHCETALAEAEIEYADEKSPSIFVKFKIKPIALGDPKLLQLADSINNNDTYFVIWTTTPWTLPANVAIALHPEYEYVVLKSKLINPKSQQCETYIMAEALVEAVEQKIGVSDRQVLAKTKGKYLEGIICAHPFATLPSGEARESMVVLDNYVTLEQGTGCVHIAPGHGEEDYKVGLKYKLPIIMPVDAKGFFTAEAGSLQGLFYDKSNKVITDLMAENGSLLCLEFFKHPYPHCWRCKKSVIFRATEQWFVAVDKDGLRSRALEEIGKTNWYPGWGENRIRGMVETRPDWCISRQRSWGVPIPAFYCKQCGKVHLTGVYNQAAQQLFAAEGSDAWFARDAAEILPPGTKCDCGGTTFKKETDILDVWFESGASHFAVIKDKAQYGWPADLYLEGSDQHRGWFQTSLLTAVAAFSRAPFKAVLTHGFTVDASGKKMSKSQGNVVNPQAVVQKYGADVLRLWVASCDFRDDMSASENILRQISEAYSKIRNTCRFLISNLGDYAAPVGTPYSAAQIAPEFSSIVGQESPAELHEIDRWILLRLAKLVDKISNAYEAFEFHVVYHSVYDFCVNDLSAFYLDLSKDKLYCDSKDSNARRSTQTAMAEILLTLMKLLAPITPFLSEDLWRHFTRLPIYAAMRHPVSAEGFDPGTQSSVLLFDFPRLPQSYLDKELEERWNRLLEIRAEVYRVLEVARQNKDIGGSIDARVEIYASENNYNFLKSVYAILPLVFICADVTLFAAESSPPEAVPAEKIKGLSIIARPAVGKKCVRCWNWRETVGTNAEHPDLCERCTKAVVG